MLRMNEQVLASLLERNNFFNSKWSGGLLTRVEVLPHKNYDFFIPNCFTQSGDDIDYFKTRVQYFLQEYIVALTKDNEGINGTEMLKNTLNFFSKLNLDTLYTKVQKKESAKISIDHNKSVFKFARFGDILVMKVSAPNDREHKAGLLAIRQMCRTEDVHNNHGIYELIDTVRCSLSLNILSKNGTINSKMFHGFHFLPLPGTEWDFDLGKLTEAYCTLDEKGVQVTTYHGFPVYAHFEHTDNNMRNIEHVRQSKTDLEDSRTLRKNNILGEPGGGDKSFRKFDDIVIIFDVRSSLPTNVFNELEEGVSIHSEQFALSRAGAILGSQLCAIAQDVYLRSHLERNPYRK